MQHVSALTTANITHCQNTYIRITCIQHDKISSDWDFILNNIVCDEKRSHSLEILSHCMEAETTVVLFETTIAIYHANYRQYLQISKKAVFHMLIKCLICSRWTVLQGSKFT